MCRRLGWGLLPFAAVLLLAADPSWKEKPLRDWNEDDAKQLLAESPWVKYATPGQVRDLSPFERRDGGDFDADVGPGIGLAGTGLLGSRKMADAIKRAHEKPALPPVMIRWESALPVRVAEQKAAEAGFPGLEGDDYAIAVYNIPTPDQWNIARELKGISFLRRNNKKDLKPTRVRILRQDDGTATLVYQFPRSVEITRKDGTILFVAQVGRLVLSQYFLVGDMQLRGEPQLLMPTSGKP